MGTDSCASQHEPGRKGQPGQCSLYSPLTCTCVLWPRGMERGDPSLRDAAAPNQEADLQRQLLEFLVSVAQIHNFPGQLNFRTEDLEISRLSELAELGLEIPQTNFTIYRQEIRPT